MINLSLASTFLSNLNPYALTISSEDEDDPQWKHWLDVSRSIWMQATSTWTNLSHVLFVDFYRLDLFASDGLDGGDYSPFMPSDLLLGNGFLYPSWMITERVGSYAGVSRYLIGQGCNSIVETLWQQLSWPKWSSVGAYGLHINIGSMDIGKGENHLAALHADLVRLNEGQARFGEGRLRYPLNWESDGFLRLHRFQTARTIFCLYSIVSSPGSADSLPGTGLSLSAHQ